MAVECHFPGWDEPVVRKVRDFLIPRPPDGPVDLRTTLVLVPTQQAGRRLREALTLFCTVAGTHLLAPAVRTPLGLLTPEDETPVAGPLDVSAVWSDLLRGIDASEFKGLFPAGVPARDFRWALRTGALLQSLREELAEHGQSIGSVVADFADRLDEVERWSDAARLEALYLSRIEGTFGRLDPCREMLRAAQSPQLPDRFDRIILACTPDPTPLALSALGRLADTVRVEVLVHAPDAMADSFDTWGRPLAARWKDEMVDMPNAAANLKLASTPAAQSRLATAVIADEAYGPRDIALGVPDAAVAPYLESALDEYGILSYDPHGAQLSHHPVFRLLRSWQHLRAQGSYAALSDLLRSADVLDHLRQSHGIPTRALLTELDEFQNTHLPDTMLQVAERLRAARGTDRGAGFHTLTDALQALQPLIGSPASSDAEASLRTLLQTVYSTRELRPGIREDQEFRTAAARVDESLRLLSEGCIHSLPLTTDEKTEALLEQLGGGRYALERLPDSVDLEGWLELAWNDAPLLIVTGMNENSVPQRPGNEAFLPDSLRRTLGLRCEDDRLARDIYLARTLVESRRASGRVCFIAGKTGADGEPLRPSRVLLRCSDAELPGRARRLFGMPDDVRPSVPSSISFQLLPSRPLQLDPGLRLPSRLAVTSFRDYLECPFRFYLKHVLRMEGLADTKREMDALDFGTLVHEVLARMAADAEMRSCQSAATLRAFLHRQAEDWASERFGPHPALRLAMQLDVATERLNAAAEAQADRRHRVGYSPV